MIDSRLIYLEKISFFVRDNHNFLKVFEIHLPIYFETPYTTIPSYHRPKLFFFYFRISLRFPFSQGKKKKKERKTLKTFYKILSLFSLKNFICHFSKEITVPQDTIDHSVSTNHRTISRIQTWNRVPDFHITEIFVPFQELRLLDKVHAATRRRLRVSRTLSTTRVRSFHERLHVGSKATRLRVPEIKRSGARPIRRDSSKFFLRSNDLDKLKSVKTSRYLSTVL